MRTHAWLLLVPLILTGCGGSDLETRTFDVRYLPPHQVDDLIGPYVYTDREGHPGRMSTSDGAVTVRETPDNLERIARVLAQYDHPKPTVMLHFQIIEADGAAEPDPAIADVERELRRLFRFDGYDLLAETKVGGIAGTQLSQVVRTGPPGDRQFRITGGVSEVRTGSAGATVTLDVQVSAEGAGPILATTVTIPSDHTVVLGTAQAPGIEGALILTVRAEVLATTPVPGAEAARTGSAPSATAPGG